MTTMSMPDPDQNPMPYTTYRRVRRVRKPKLSQRMRSVWKRMHYRRRRFLVRILIGFLVTLLAVLMGVIIVSIR